MIDCKRTVLLVHDDSVISDAFKTRLEHLGYFVVHYLDGRKAIAEIEEGQLLYSIAFVDASLPGASGQEVIDTSKKTNTNTPVIGMSSYEQTSLQRSFLKGTDGRLLPENWDDLENLLNKHLGDRNDRH